MKIFLAISAYLICLSTYSLAASSDSSEIERERGFAVDKLAKSDEAQPGRQRMEGRMKNASLEEKDRMEKHHEMMKDLTSAQREEVKKEMERHRAEMKKITGKEMPPMPPMRKRSDSN